MGRKSIAEEYYEEISEDEVEGTWLVLRARSKNDSITEARGRLLITTTRIAKRIKALEEKIGVE